MVTLSILDVLLSTDVTQIYRDRVEVIVVLTNLDLARTIQLGPSAGPPSQA